MRTVIISLLLCGAAAADVRTRKIPNIFPVLLALISLLCLENAIAGFICAGLPLLLAACLSDQIGGGDVKFMTAAAMNLNVLYGIFLVMFTFVISTIHAKIRHKNSIPLAPFLCAGFFITLLVERIIAYV